jgi:hypothetical protein
LKIFVILMRRRTRGVPKDSDVPLDKWAVKPDELRDIEAAARSHDIEPLDIVSSLGFFDLVLLCRADSNQLVADFLNGLVEWHTRALLATSHTRWEFLGVGS